MLDVASYLTEVIRIHKTGEATEHYYRPALQALFDSIADNVKALNEPRSVKVGRPDFVFHRGAITVGHCEAKDIGLDINPRAMKDANKEQFERYRKALPNLVYTNGVDFRFYKQGELTRDISIADLVLGIQPKPDQFAALAHQLRDFCAERLQTITSAERLAEMMAGKAVLIKDILFNSLKDDKETATALNEQVQAFRVENQRSRSQLRKRDDLDTVFVG